MNIVKWLRGLIKRDEGGTTDDEADYSGDQAGGARLDSLGAIGALGNPPVMPQDDHPRH